MNQNIKNTLKALETKIENVSNKIFQAGDNGHDVKAMFLRCKLVKLAQKYGELLEKYEANGRNVKQTIVLESYGFNIQFFVENAVKSEKISERKYEKFYELKIFDKSQKQAAERAR